MAIRARFKGALRSPRPGEPQEPVEFLQGIPARDLSDEEYAALTTEDKARVRGSNLYDVASPDASKGDS